MENIFSTAISILNNTVIRYFLLAGIPFILFYLLLPDRLKRFKIQPKAAIKKDWLREIWYSMQSSLVFTAITAVLLVPPLHPYTLMYDHIHDYPVWYIGVGVVVSLVIHDTYFYWMHRLLHHPRLFKYTHLVHHKSTNPSPWASYSFHLLEAIAEGGVLLIVVMVIPMHLITLLSFTFTSFFINVYGHLGYEIAPAALRRSWLFEIFNTSVHHNLHHSKFKGNYGLYFRIWDRAMGTEHPDYVKEYDRIQEQRFGKQHRKKASPNPVAQT
ncbi:sterol desaturase family protein [Chitinophaga nivalis]|uniref:Sterol desaturase family protein n=1 Tax=Chitinophaga nivalis TaxID=2991709 RepID=A0ABT3IUS2_9BACT|nr:sterol desaturase family protein [Chitinophaga nivalis]MCW3462845.1 sterol desaturase family protein [Chitinophaga nivalis]MCW3487465.1 sterol desaturase family protein [Chitinophaga nivalis]